MVFSVLVGCEKYRPQPLEPLQTLHDVERKRRLIDAAGDRTGALPTTDSATTERGAPQPEGRKAVDQPPTDQAKPKFTFARAVELMRDHSPALKEVKAEYETAHAVAQIKTPLPNPAVEAGPQIGFGPDAGDSIGRRLTPFGSIGFAIPTGRRLKRQDEVNRAQADLARTEAAVKYRELYLDLRKSYSRLILAKKRTDVRTQIAESAEKSTQLMKRLIEAGNATALDSGLIDLEYARLRTDLFSSQSLFASAASELSRLTGVHSEHFEPLPDDPLPMMPDTTPTKAELQELLVSNHPELARLRGRYEVSERELRLEIARQYPDFKFGPTGDRDVGDRKNVLGLTLGIDLPLFDRNQQAVMQAKKRRDEIRVKYEGAANRALAELDRVFRNYELATQKLKLLKDVVLPKAESNISLAKRSLEAGGIDSLRFLETERGQRAVLLDALETDLEVREAWVDLEQAIGYPIMNFPTESKEAQPGPLETIAEPINGREDADSQQPASKGNE